MGSKRHFKFPKRLFRKLLVFLENFWGTKYSLENYLQKSSKEVFSKSDRFEATIILIANCLLLGVTLVYLNGRNSKTGGDIEKM